MLLSGHDVAADPARALAGLSFLPQSPRFHQRLTVAQILAFYARLRGLPAARIETVIGRWGLGEYLRRHDRPAVGRHPSTSRARHPRPARTPPS